MTASQEKGTTENCFYSEIVNGSIPSQATTEGKRGNEKTSEEMKSGSDMYKEAGWDFEGVWSIDSDSKLPILKFLATDTECKHENTEVVGKKDPTCTEPGYTGDTVCKDCGKVLEKGEAIPATGHHDDDKDGKCDGCGKDMQDVCEHVWGAWTVTKNATCTEPGAEARICTKCGKIEIKVILPKGHDYETVGKKDATCEEEGYTGDTVCKNCDNVLSKGETIPAKGHHDANGDGKCDDCGKNIGGNSGNSNHKGFAGLMNWFTRLMILVRHLIGLT